VVRHTLLPAVLDSQAGLKGMSERAARVIFPRLTIRGFGFDVEVLYIARRHHLTCRQIPVFFRYDQEPTTVHFLRDSVRMFLDVMRVWRNGRRSVYD
jgi:dolichyl-phosphate beta-glucosyltransferase